LLPGDESTLLFRIAKEKGEVWGIVSSPLVYGTTANAPDLESL